MIFFLARKSQSGNPCFIKVPSRDADSQPYVGFDSRALGEAYLDFVGMNDEDYYCVSQTEIEHDIDSNVDIFLFSNQRQFHEIAEDRQAYDYEKHIIENPC